MVTGDPPFGYGGDDLPRRLSEGIPKDGDRTADFGEEVDALERPSQAGKEAGEEPADEDVGTGTFLPIVRCEFFNELWLPLLRRDHFYRATFHEQLTLDIARVRTHAISRRRARGVLNLDRNGSDHATDETHGNQQPASLEHTLMSTTVSCVTSPTAVLPKDFLYAGSN